VHVIADLKTWAFGDFFVDTGTVKPLKVVNKAAGDNSLNGEFLL